MKAHNLLWIPVLGLVIAGAWAHQTGGEYDLSWSTVDGGGGSSQGPTFAVAGTLGQPDGGGGEGGAFGLAGGFWPAFAAAPQTPAATETPSPTPTGTPVVTLTATPPVTASPTSTPTSTVTATPRETSPVPTETPALTPTPIPGDINGDFMVNGSDLFHFGLDWQESAAVADPRCNAFTDTIIDERDLLLLLDQWSR